MIAGRMLRRLFLISCWLCTAGWFAGSAAQQPGRIRLAGIFGDGMVIQRDMDVPVWGWGQPQEEIRIDFAGKQVRCRADNEGKWLVRIPSGHAGGPYEMTISAARDTVVLRDVLVGEVWIASGQSNMAFQLKNASEGESAIKEAEQPDIRLFTVLRHTSMAPLDTLRPSSWTRCTPETAAPFSAVAYHFAKHLYDTYRIPIGIIHVSWGGTSAEAWTSADKLLSLPDLRHKVLELDRDTARWSALAKRSMELDSRRGPVIRTAQNGIKAGVHQPGYDDTGWPSVALPVTMPAIGKPDYWGFVWLRTTVTLPDTLPEEWLLRLPVQAERAEVYLNGTVLQADGKRKGWYSLPVSAARRGENVIALRILTYRGTAVLGHADSARAGIVSASGTLAVPLHQSWRYHAGMEPEVPPLQSYFNTPTVLFNALIHPLIPFGIKGVIWYQGESNVQEPEQYATLFPALINDWRDRWKQGDFPFLYVQLAGMERSGKGENGNLQWALLQEAQARTGVAVKAVGMAVGIDAGEQHDIHPRNKAVIGKRLSLLARRIAYAEDIVCEGPVYKKLDIKGNVAYVSFDNSGSGLRTTGTGRLAGFSIAGADRQFYPAEARIEGGRVAVSHPHVRQPVAVRYGFDGWADYSLYNQEGLPAAPFRTDTWNE